MPNFVVLGCLEVGEKFSGGWWVVGGVGAFRHQLQSYTNLKLDWVRLWLGWAVTIIYLLLKLTLFSLEFK